MSARRLLAVWAAVLAALALAGPSAAALRLTIHTVPALRGVPFSFDGRTYRSDRHGRVAIVTKAGRHRLRAHALRRRGATTRATFDRWLDDTFTARRTVRLAENTDLVVGYGVAYRVGFAFVDLHGQRVAADRVRSVTLVSSIGEKFVLEPGRRYWLDGARVARRLNGLERTLIRYSVISARMSGANVVNKAQQRFYLARRPTLRIRLSLYRASFRSRDLVFRRAVGSGILLTFPDHHVEEHSFDGAGALTLDGLPRGTYEVKVKTSAGISMAVPVSLSRNQDVDLKVITYLDLAVGFVLFAGVSFVLVVARRPHLRRAFRLDRAARVLRFRAAVTVRHARRLRHPVQHRARTGDPR